MESEFDDVPGAGRGRGRGAGRTPLAGLAELDAQLGILPEKDGHKPPSGRGRGGGGPPNKPSNKPLFTKGDWTCPQCSNINWERRMKCNICQFDKPGHLSQVEERTGAGGGFNERQNRASGLTVEVDEEGYDDFGRRKQAAAKDRKAKEAAALARLNASFGLAPAGSSNLDSDNTEKKDKKKRERSRSRSRSKSSGKGRKSKGSSKASKSRSRSRSRGSSKKSNRTKY